MNDQTLQKVIKEILLTEHKYQYYNEIYQLVWRVWEKLTNEGKDLIFLSKKQFIDLNVNYGTVESILRALRQVKKEMGIKDLVRYEKAQQHRLAYKKN